MLVFDGCRVPSSAVLGEVGRGFDVANTWLGTTRLQVAASCLGRARRALDLAVRHAATRRQFGRQIGVYQAVSHKLADTYVETQLARSLTYWAAWCVAEDDPQATVAAAAAKSYATDAAVAACERSIQVLGGIGFTWEHMLHRYYKRALWLQSFAGSGSTHRAAVAEALLGTPAAV